MGALSRSQLEKSKYKQEKNVTEVWEPGIGFGGAFRAELNREELRAKIRQKQDKYIPEQFTKQPWGFLGGWIGLWLAQSVNEGKVNPCLGLRSPGNTF